MIYIDRNQHDESGQPIEPSARWFSKAAAEQQAANAAAGRGYEFKADIYGDDSVRTAFDRLFHDKCGYCEHRIVRFDQNVDHYRPKGRVAEEADHPGYYWLAYEWKNLIPACTACNQKRSERLEYPNIGRLPPMGKADSFPLIDETTRAWSPLDDLTLEEPFLLDPTVDFPEEHLSFYPDGTAYGKTPRGEETIRILGLNGRKLYQDRRRTIRDVVGWLTDSKTSASAAAMISRSTVDSAQYAAAARAVVNNPTAFGIHS